MFIPNKPICWQHQSHLNPHNQQDSTQLRKDVRLLEVAPSLQIE